MNKQLINFTAFLHDKLFSIKRYSPLWNASHTEKKIQENINDIVNKLNELKLIKGGEKDE